MQGVQEFQIAGGTPDGNETTQAIWTDWLNNSVRGAFDQGKKALKNVIDPDGYKVVGLEKLFHQGHNSLRGNTISSGGGSIEAGNIFKPKYTINFIMKSFSPSPSDDIMRLIYHADPDEQRRNILNTFGAHGCIIEGTCEWIKERLEYQQWLDTDSSILWLSGGPGKGKTFLSVYLTYQLDDIVKQNSGMLIYYFFDGEDQINNTAEGALRSMIWKMCRERSALKKYVSEEYQDRGDHFTFELLWSIFVKMLNDPEAGTTYCILDGLERCEGSSLGKLLDKFGNFSGQYPSPRFKLILVSQSKNDSVTNKLNAVPQLQLDSEELSKFVDADIDKFIKYKVESLREGGGWSEEFRDYIWKKFLDGAGHSFLWVALVAKDIESAGNDAGAIKEILEKVPKKLLDLYQHMLNKVNSNTDRNKRIGRRILRTVLFACRPLTPTELGAVLREERGEQSMKQKIQDCCGDLLIVGNTVTFFHQSSVRIFLERELYFHDNKLTTNLSMGEACFSCISNWSKELDLEWKRNNHTREPMHQIVKSYLERYPLLDYAIRYWPEHFRYSGIPARESAILADKAFWTKNSPQREIWLEAYWQLMMPYWNHPLNFRPIHFAAYFGLHWLVKRYLDEMNPQNLHHNATIKTNYGMTPLHWAARNGHKDVVTRLLDVPKLDLETKGYRMTPLNWAVQNGRVDVAEALLEKGADVEAKAFGMTPIHSAVYEGNKKLVNLLLKHHAKLETRVSIDMDTMMAIVRSGFAAFPWTSLPYRNAQNESRLDHQEDIERRTSVARAEKAHKRTVVHAILAAIAVILAALVLAMKSWPNLGPFLEALGWEPWESILVITVLLLLWLGVATLYRVGFKALAAASAILVCAGFAGGVAGWAVMLVAATVCCSRDDMISTTISMVLDAISNWTGYLSLGGLAIIAGLLSRLDTIVWVLLLIIWGILLCVWASVPGLLVLIALFSDGTREWGLLAIPCIGFAVAAFATLTAELVVFREGALAWQRAGMSSLVLGAAWLSGTALIYLKPVPSVSGNIRHWTIVLLGGVWSLFGAFVSTMIAECVTYILDGIKWLQGKLGTGSQGHTSLLLAVQSGHSHIVKLLLDKGADVEVMDAKSQSAEVLAGAFQRNEVVDIIKKHRGRR